MNVDPTHHPHRRFNALTGDWILCSPHRTKRPWQGKVETPPPDNRPAYDPKCYLCPGNQRAGELKNPAYASTYVFTNDFAAMLPDTPVGEMSKHPLLRAETVHGTSRVICFSPRHDLSLAKMEVTDIRRVVDVWCEQMSELGRRYRWVQIFENKGDVMGCSNPHPHGQIWAGSALPNEPAKEEITQREYFNTHRKPLLMDYADVEIRRKDRMVIANAHWLVLVPYWALWPYETLLMPRRHVPGFAELSDAERSALADILKRLLTRYDNLFNVSFPYSMGWHGAPTGPGAGESPHWQLHAHFFPPLLRSATVKKFMVGYEMLAEAQRDLTAEQAAERLRALPETHA